MRRRCAIELEEKIAEKKAECYRYRTSGQQLRLPKPSLDMKRNDFVDHNPRSGVIAPDPTDSTPSNFSLHGETGSVTEPTKLLPTHVPSSNAHESGTIERENRDLMDKTGEMITLLERTGCVREQLEKEVDELRACAVGLENQCDSLQIRCEEAEGKLSLTRAEHVALGNAIQRIQRETINKLNEIESVRFERTRLEVEISNATSTKRELSQQLEESTRLQSRLVSDLQNTAERFLQAQSHLADLKRVNARVTRYGECLKVERERIKCEKEMEKRNAKYLKHQKSFLNVIQRSESNDRRVSWKIRTGSGNQQKCNETESHFKCANVEKNHPILINDEETKALVHELGINEALIAAQSLEDHDECIRAIVEIIAKVVERFGLEKGTESSLNEI